MNIYTGNTVYTNYINYLNEWQKQTATSAHNDGYDAMSYMYGVYNQRLKTIEPEEKIEPTPVPTLEEKRKLLKELIE